jgi:hypothetical protein
MHLPKALKKRKENPRASIKISTEKYTIAKEVVALEFLRENMNGNIEENIKRPKNFTREEWLFILGKLLKEMQ